MIGLIWTLFLIGLVVVFIGGFLWRVPKKHYAVRDIFGKRKPDSVREGLTVWWPKPIGDMEFISLEPRTVEIPLTFQVTDEVEMTSTVTVPYTPDPEYNDPETRINRFSLVADKEESDLQPYLRRLVEEKFGGLGGKISGEEAVALMESTSAYINVALRISKAKAPHLNHALPCGIPGCDIQETSVSARNLMKYLALHWRDVNDALDKEKNDANDMSYVEKEWGIDIGRVSYSQPRFAPAVQKARDARKETEKRIEGVRKEIALAEEARKALGLSPSDAVTFVREGTNPTMRVSSMHFMGTPPPGFVHFNPLEGGASGTKQQGEDGGPRDGKQRKGGRK